MKTKIVLASVVSALLAGCGGGGGGESSSVEPPAGTGSEPPVSKVAVSYKAAVLPLFVGSYTGADCIKLTGGAMAERGPAVVKVGADGMVETIGVSASVLQPTVSMAFSRTLDASGPRDVSYLISEPRNPNGLTLMLAETAQDARTGVYVVNNSLSVNCEAPEAAILKTRSLYGALAKFIDSPRRTVSCTKGIGAAVSLVNASYQVAGGEMKLDDQTRSLTSGLQGEMAVVPADGGLAYWSQSLDGTALNLTLDPYGNPQNMVGSFGKSGLTYSCDLKPKL
ncbi:hypothetical protein [Rhodoferax sp.]|uniref:hypothetical protein n=1 Tax=Rhodoferax sp. TaxID=50421 RepID=UPI002758F18B|nr:hypothetical protein [Rhodoferax sp.]